MNWIVSSHTDDMSAGTKMGSSDAHRASTVRASSKEPIRDTSFPGLKRGLTRATSGELGPKWAKRPAPAIQRHVDVVTENSRTARTIQPFTTVPCPLPTGRTRPRAREGSADTGNPAFTTHDH